MSELKYGECPYCGRAFTADHKCWQRSVLPSLKGQFNDPDLLRAEIERLLTDLRAANDSIAKLQHDNRILNEQVNEKIRELEECTPETEWILRAKQAELQVAGMVEALHKINDLEQRRIFSANTIGTNFAGSQVNTICEEALSATPESVKRIGDAVLALEQLCKLKRIKDKIGKTELYLREQPVAWKRAMEAVRALEQGDKRG